MVAIEGTMSEGGKNRIEIAVVSIPGLIAMKGFAIKNRHKQKDAHDIYYCVRNYPGGVESLANTPAVLIKPLQASLMMINIASLP